MVRTCWVNFQCRGVLLIWIIVGQGPIALAVGAGGGCLDIFSLVYHFSFLSPSLWETARYRLKYCLKGPLTIYVHTRAVETLLLHGPSMIAVKANIYEMIQNQFSSIAFDKTSSYWSALKAPNFWAFHWSPHGSLVSIGQHFLTTRVIHLPKRTKTSLITEINEAD